MRPSPRHSAASFVAHELDGLVVAGAAAPRPSRVLDTQQVRLPPPRELKLDVAARLRLCAINGAVLRDEHWRVAVLLIVAIAHEL